MKILGWVGSHVAAVLVAGALVYLVVDRAHTLAQLKALQAQTQKLQTESAKQQGFQAIAPTSSGRTEAALSPEAKAELAAIRKTVKETSVTLHGLSNVVFSRDLAGQAVAATATAPPYCQDAFGIVRVNTRDCSIELNLEELVETNVLHGIDGKTRLVKQTVKLLDPVTHLPIPGDPPKITSSFQVTEEQAAEKVFGLKVLGGIDERMAPGLGLQIAEKWRLSARLIGFYAPKDHDLRGLIGVGWRPRIAFFNSAMSLGAGVGISTKGGGLIYGAHLTAPLGAIE